MVSLLYLFKVCTVFDKLRFTAEMIGLVAIVVSLLLVVQELQQTQAALASAAYQARAETQIDEAIALFESEHLPPIFEKIRSDQGLSPEEQTRFFIWLRAYHRIHELTILQHEQGILEDWALEEPRLSLNRIFTSLPLARRNWIDTMRSIVSPQYRAFVDNNVDT